MRKSITDLVKKSVNDLEKELNTAKQEVNKLIIQLKLKPEKDSNIVFKKRRRIAQIATILQEKKLFEASQPQKKAGSQKTL